jgi:hypothetical protein
MPAYVRPNDPGVKVLLSTILAQKSSPNGYDSLRDWVASNIKYYLPPNVDAYWQYPNETIIPKINGELQGSCIDYSTLLCSLFRADNVPANQVYVAIAYQKGVPQTPSTCHAFLIGNFQTGYWSIIDPQADTNSEASSIFGQGSDLGDFYSYDVVYYFNDQGYFKGSPALYQPNIKIQTLTLPSNANTGSGLSFPTTFRLTNAESVDVMVNWQANSSVTGNYDSGSVIVPKNSFVDVTRSYLYTKAGSATITYTVSFDGVQLDQKSDTMNVVAFVPNIKIQSVTLPVNVKANPNASYPTTFRLTNSESVDVTVTWKAHSSITGDYDSGIVTVPKNGFQDVTRSYIYGSAGTANLTYTVSYNGAQVATWSGSLIVSPFPNVTIQSITLPTNVKANSGLSYATTIRLMNNESTDVMVTWKAHSSVTGNFDSGTVTITKNSYVDIARSYFYTTVGIVNLTYTIYYSGNLVDTKSASMSVTVLTNIKIQNVTFPTNARVGYTSYNMTFRLVNNESVDMVITWKANSSVTGNFDSGSVTIPKNGYIDVTRGYVYSTAGPVTITYTIYFNGNLLDTWSGVMSVLP